MMASVTAARRRRLLLPSIARFPPTSPPLAGHGRGGRPSTCVCRDALAEVQRPPMAAATCRNTSSSMPIHPFCAHEPSLTLRCGARSSAATSCGHRWPQLLPMAAPPRAEGPRSPPGRGRGDRLIAWWSGRDRLAQTPVRHHGTATRLPDVEGSRCGRHLLSSLPRLILLLSFHKIGRFFLPDGFHSSPPP
ncbi:hypothetical protein NL676_013525 [Syzygium grande]|nr:hypothetical protein NL676_013525 [Syzygium grande]